ncbi:MAG: ATP-binding cassette domain-containing protein [SAR324 cluster bacterium]|nr:ATP-binding cassette domain-containing protein [SAR324 cluster bacterium]
MIEAQGLYKAFRIYRKSPGLKGALKSLVYRNHEMNEAVKPFDLSVNHGEIIGLLGPNGAGKTTLMKMFTGIIVPSGGSLSVMGHVPEKRERLFRKKIALVMGQKSQLWWDLPAMDSFELLGRYYEIDRNTFKQRVELLSFLLQVEHILHVHVRKLSLGERMKVELMASLLHQPEIIFLDEPTIGLDLIAQQKIREFIKSYHQETGSTIILTSHYMADVTALCSRLVLIFQGGKRFDGPIQEFEKLLGEEKDVSFLFAEPISRDDMFWTSLDTRWNEERTHVHIRLPMKQLREISAEILHRYPVLDFSTENLPVERVMKTLMENPQLLSASH